MRKQYYFICGYWFPYFSSLQVPDNFLDMYPNEDNPDRRAMLGMVSAVDDAVGQVVAALQTTGRYDNTLIVFSSDNGGYINHSGIGPISWLP